MKASLRALHSPSSSPGIDVGPTVEQADGTRMWRRDGKLHREDGPAEERTDGTKIWYRNGELHREDGPAVEFGNGTKVWYLNDRR